MTDRLFPEAAEKAIKDLIRALEDSPNSYSIEVFRYEGEDHYKATVGFNQIKSLWPIEGDSHGN